MPKVRCPARASTHLRSNQVVPGIRCQSKLKLCRTTPKKRGINAQGKVPHINRRHTSTPLESTFSFQAGLSHETLLERSVFTLYRGSAPSGVLQDAVVYSIDTFDEFLSSDYVVHLLIQCMKSCTIPCTFLTKELQSRRRPGTSVTYSQRSPFRSAFGFEKKRRLFGRLAYQITTTNL